MINFEKINSDRIRCILLDEYLTLTEIDADSFFLHPEISKFSTSNNTNIADYLKEKSVSRHFDNFEKVFLIVSYTEFEDEYIFCRENHEVLAFFSLATFSIIFEQDALEVGLDDPEITAIPTIELSHFGVNDEYKHKYPKMGRTIFNAFIFNVIIELSKYVGIQYISIFVADGGIKPRAKLIEYYENLEFVQPEDRDMNITFNPSSYSKSSIFMMRKLPNTFV